VFTGVITPTRSSDQTGEQSDIAGTFMPVHVNVAQLDQYLAFYEGLFGEPCNLRFQYKERDLELAAVGPVCLIAGSLTGTVVEYMQFDPDKTALVNTAGSSA
jgi:hypothetical protein